MASLIITNVKVMHFYLHITVINIQIDLFTLFGDLFNSRVNDTVSQTSLKCINNAIYYCTVHTIRRGSVSLGIMEMM